MVVYRRSIEGLGMTKGVSGMASIMPVTNMPVPGSQETAP